MIRAFIAVTLAEPIIEEIAKSRSALQEAGGDMRWTRMEGPHLTLKFLGDIARNQVEPIVEVLHNIAQQHPPLHLVAQGLGVFPHLRRPRVLWVGLKGDGVVALRGCPESKG